MWVSMSFIDSERYVTNQRRTITVIITAHRKLNLTICQGFLETPSETPGFYQKGGFLNSFTQHNTAGLWGFKCIKYQ